jgi:hypothetical protein
VEPGIKGFWYQVGGGLGYLLVCFLCWYEPCGNLVLYAPGQLQALNTCASEPHVQANQEPGYSVVWPPMALRRCCQGWASLNPIARC